jgi:hypothetical protein
MMKRAAAIHRFCDRFSEVLLYGMIVFSPWAFGTTERWSTWTMNIAGYGLGLCWLAKLLARGQTGFRPERWGDQDAGRKGWTSERVLTACLGGVTVLLLAYVLVSAVNARAEYHHSQRLFAYRDCLRWLPHSYDRAYTWLAFWQYLALALSFWSVRDWLLGMTREERIDRASPSIAGSAPVSTADQRHRRFAAGEGSERSEDAPRHRHAHAEAASERASSSVPARLRRLLWVLCLNGAMLAVEGILQRLSGTSKLLWLVLPHINVTAEAQFGPFAYRANGAQYLNLIWPLCLGFWWWLRTDHRGRHRRARRVGGDAHVLLLPCAVLAGAAPIVSTSRGGAMVAAAGSLVAVAILIVANRGRHWLGQLGILLVFGATAGTGLYLGWEKLAPRLRTMFQDNLSNRLEIYTNAIQMAQDYPVFGTGAGSFAAVYQLYRSDPNQTWHAYLHDDWLQTRVTLGWIGFGLVLAGLGLVGARWFLRHGIVAERPFVALLVLALVGCLAHARFDFPFQVYSLAFLFTLQAAILFCLSRR